MSQWLWVSAAAGTLKVTDGPCRIKSISIPQVATLGAAITFLSATLTGTDSVGITQFEIPSGFDPDNHHQYIFGEGILIQDRLDIAHGSEAFGIEFDAFS